MTTVNYAVSREEYFTVYIKRVVLGIMIKIFWVIFGAVFAASSLSVADFQGFTDWKIVIPAAMIVGAEFALPIALVSLVVVATITWFRLQSDSPMVDARITFGFAPEGLKSETKITNWEFKWSFVDCARDCGSYYLLQIKQPMGEILFIPKKAFSEEERIEWERLMEKNFPSD